MRYLTLNKWLLAALVLLMPIAAQAAGLGRLTVVSALGQPLQAEIELLSVSKEELASLTVQLASVDAYRQANLQYAGSLPSLRLSIEKRASGQPYIKIVSTRPVNEPFIDLLIELNWASGRLVREYTALLDPPGYGAAPLPPAPIAEPEVRPAPPPAAVAPVAPAPAPAPVISAPAAAAPAPGSYGPIQRGETMGKIAAEVKPAGVSLEQMMIALLRNNRDAFINDNVNLVKAGKILRVPEKAEVEAIPQAEAVKEFRTQVADWNAYRQRVAAAAGIAPEARGTATGKITTRVDDPAEGGAKDVVKLSKGEPPGAAAGKGGKAASPAERIRNLEEEAIAREKALTEANDRIAQLEKTIGDLRRLAEIKSPGMAAAQQKAQAVKGDAPPPAKPVAAVKPEPAPKPEMAKPDAPKPEGPGDKVAMAPEQPAGATEKPAAAPEASPPPKPKPKPRVVQPPPPPPEPELMDMVMENLPLVAGGTVVLLGGLYFGLARRRRSRAAELNAVGGPAAPTLNEEVAGEAPKEEDVDTLAAPPRAAGDEVDPIAEAEVYIAYGRDAQAEEILKEAMAKEPNRADIQLKLLEIYSARKDKNAFGGLAQTYQRVTGGQGDGWLKAAAMGYVLDPSNPLYESGRDLAASMPPGGQGGADFDFNLDTTGPPTTTDITFDTQPEPDESTVVESTKRQAEEQASETPDIAIDEPQPGSTTTDISFDVPESDKSAATDISLDAEEPKKTEDGGGIDFNIELPSLEEQPTQSQAPEESKPAGTDSGMDFKLDLGDINLNLDEKGGGDAGDRGKDTQWYDVQTKFDLAKAYQEMGDKDGAKEILQEVVKEGDAEQQAEAKKLLETLG